MTYHQILLILHLLAATVWIGGHLILVSVYLPKAHRDNDKFVILDFQSRFERFGMISLLVLIASGVAMAIDYGVYPNRWFHFADAVETVVSIKLMLLAATFAFAVSATRLVIPKLKTNSTNLGLITFHIVSVTVIAVAMLIVGSSIRFGGI